MMQRRQQQGIALIEAMIATVILAIGLLGTIGLQARAYSAINDAGMRVEATLASEKLLGLMNTDVTHLPLYAMTSGGTPDNVMAQWVADTKAAIPGAVISVAVTPPTDDTTSHTAVTVKISWVRKAGGPTNTSTMTSYLSDSK